jgi:hypothetical protein
MDVGAVAIVAAIVGAIATIVVAWISARAQIGAGPVLVTPEPAPSRKRRAAAPPPTTFASQLPGAFATICRALLWVLMGLSYFLGFSALTGASFSIGIVAVKAFAHHSVGLADSFILQFAVLSAFGFFCGSVWHTLLRLWPRSSGDMAERLSLGWLRPGARSLQKSEASPLISQSP